MGGRKELEFAHRDSRFLLWGLTERSSLSYIACCCTLAQQGALIALLLMQAYRFASQPQ